MSDQLEIAARIHENEAVIATSRAVMARNMEQPEAAEMYEAKARAEARRAALAREKLAAGD